MSQCVDAFMLNPLMATDSIFLGALPNRAPSDAFKLWEKIQKAT